MILKAAEIFRQLFLLVPLSNKIFYLVTIRDL